MLTESLISTKDRELFDQSPDFYIKKADLKDSLYSFVLEFWDVVEPGATFKGNWTIQAVCEHLEAVTRGDIRNLIINIPPRFTKSLIVNVFWPAWSWARKASKQFIFSAYSDSLAVRDSIKCRTLIKSEKFRKYYFESGNLRSDQDTKHEFVNYSGGHRIITTVGGSATGKGADIIVTDDPNDAKHARSKNKLEETQYWWDNVMSTRLNNAKTGSRVIIQQRIAEGDLTGHVLKKQKDLPDDDPTKYVHLYIPMEFEEKNICSTKIGWTDPRTQDGELAWDERFGPKEIKTYKVDLGSASYAGQMQQRPAPAMGAIFKRPWFKFYKELPAIDYYMISVDCTFKNTEGSDYVAMGVWGVKDANKYLMWLVRKKLDFPETLVELAALNKRFPNARYNLVEDKANGSAVLSVFKNKIKGLLPFEPGNNSKEARAASIAPQVEAGNLWLPEQYYEPNRRALPWIHMVDDYIEEMVTFPKSDYDDVVDMTSQAFIKIGDKSGWLAELTKAAEKYENNKPETFTQNISQIMGWDLGDDIEDPMDEILSGDYG